MDAFSPQQDTLPIFTSAKKDASYLHKNIGPYRVDALWKKGPLSHLYLATDLKHHRSCVLKILSPDLLKLPEMVDQFLKESEIISTIKHPNIVSVFDTGEWENGFYIAMQYLQGISLKQFLTHHKLTPTSALNITLKVAYALLHLHTHSIIHRDIKPENILILDTGEIKLIDFGIAKLEGEVPIGLEKKSPSIIGTPNYMSPEQKKNPLRVTYQSDIYSLGMVLQELLLGKMCHGKNQTHLIDEPFQNIVKKATQSSRDNRFEDIVDFIQSLTLTLKNLPQSSIPHPQTQSLPTFKSFNDPIPKWPLVDIGMKCSKPNTSSSFYKFLSFQNGSHAFLYCSDTNDSEDPSMLMLMKGYLENSFLNHKEQGITAPQFLTIFHEAQKHFLVPMIQFTYLLLTPRLNRATFISSCFGPFFMAKTGKSVPQTLAAGPLVASDIVQTTQHWNEGDILSLHSFSIDTPLPLSPPSYEGLPLSSSADKLYKYLVSKSKTKTDLGQHMVISFEHLG